MAYGNNEVERKGNTEDHTIEDCRSNAGYSTDGLGLFRQEKPKLWVKITVSAIKDLIIMSKYFI